MMKLLKCLVVMFLLVAVAALTLAVMLFNRRELLKGRTQKLEGAVTAIAACIETDAAVAPEASPTYPERDVDRVTDEPNENPARASFWKTFRHELQETDRRTLDLTRKRSQLMTYYRLDPVTLKPWRDPLTGRKSTQGEGTMQELLDHVIGKAEDQLVRLNETRNQLGATRKELVHTITDLNGRKHELRQALHTITSRDTAIAGLRDDVEQRDRQIDACRDRISGLNDELLDKKNRIARQDEDIVGFKDRIAWLEHRIDVLVGRTDTPVPVKAWDSLNRGLKGSVTAVHREWNFVVLALTQEFVEQYVAAMQKDPSIPNPEFVVARSLSGPEAFVTKVRLNHLDPKRRLGVADILTDWQQSPIHPGDLVVF